MSEQTDGGRENTSRFETDNSCLYLPDTDGGGGENTSRFETENSCLYLTDILSIPVQYMLIERLGGKSTPDSLTVCT